jgi:hypothetical protein
MTYLAGMNTLDEHTNFYCSQHTFLDDFPKGFAKGSASGSSFKSSVSRKWYYQQIQMGMDSME